MDLIITILPVVAKDLPISPRFTPYDFLSRCKFGTLTTRQPMVEFYLLTFPRFPLQKKEHKSYFGENRIHDFRTSRCAGYLLDHSGAVVGACTFLELCRVKTYNTYHSKHAVVLCFLVNIKIINGSEERSISYRSIYKPSNIHHNNHDGENPWILVNVYHCTVHLA